MTDTGYHVVDLPGGGQAQVRDTELSLEIPDGVVTLHRNKAAARTIEYWRRDDVFCALRDIIADEVQEAENAGWDVLASKDLDRAFGASLDLIGRLVGEARNGRADPGYRARLKARERINRSQGRTNDVIAMLALVDPATFTITDVPPASLVVAADAPLSGFATGEELGSLIAQCRAAGVGAFLVLRTGVDGFVLGDYGGTIITGTLGDYGGTLVTDPLPDGVAA